jgi:transposase
MPDLDHVSTEQLRAQLHEVDGAEPAQRLMVAIAYKQGVSQSDLAEWYGRSRKTIYNWLERLADEPLSAAIRDQSPPGRPSALSDEEREQIKATIQRPPDESGYTSFDSWNVGLVRYHVVSTHGVDYSRTSCWRLMREAREE